MNKLLGAALVLACLLSASFVFADNKLPAPTATASLTLHNRSDYKMTAVIWSDGRKCTEHMPLLDAASNLNLPQPAPITVPANRTIAVAVGIFELQDKAPVLCEYAVSFKAQAGLHYLIEYDVNDRHCYGNLFRDEKGAYKMTTEEDKERPRERMLSFGWDKLEPACDDGE